MYECDEMIKYRTESHFIDQVNRVRVLPVNQVRFNLTLKFNLCCFSSFDLGLNDLDLDKGQFLNVILYIPYNAMCVPNIKGFQ